jgi:hypothetical protein
MNNGFGIADRLKVLGDFLELANGGIRAACSFSNRLVETVVDVVVYQSLLSIADRFLYSMQLLRNFQTASFFLQHSENAVKVTLSPLEPFDYVRMRGVCCHNLYILYPIQEDMIYQSIKKQHPENIYGNFTCNSQSGSVICARLII